MRVLLLGDGIILTTGFAKVLRHIAAALVERGHTVAQLASLDGPPHCDRRPYEALGVRPYFPDRADALGVGVLDEVLMDFRPDVIVINGDLGSAYLWQRHLETRAAGDIPRVLYAPVEGAPVCDSLARAMRQNARAVTYTRWGAERLREEWGIAIPWVYHGVDTGTFKPLDPDTRERVRAEMGWTGRYVVAYIARNQYRKAQDRMLRAAAVLKAAGETDVLLYLHCRPFEGYWNQGWDLAWLSHALGVTDMVQFPGEPAIRGVEAIDLAERIGAADLYVHASMVEGFGLPIVEAMACGTPVVVPYDQGAMTELVGGADPAESCAAALLIGSDSPTWYTGAKLTAVAPETIAHAVTMLRGGGEAVTEAPRRRALARAHGSGLFSWKPMQDLLARLVEEAAGEPNEVPEPALMSAVWQVGTAISR